MAIITPFPMSQSIFFMPPKFRRLIAAVEIIPSPLNLKKENRMAERKRAIQLKLWVDENEKNLIEKKMKILGTRNFGAYARKMLIDGYIIKVDYSEQRKLAAEVNKIGVNINQICKRIDSTDRVYSEDVAELRKRMDEVWRLLKSKL